jgi:hypothetical protein
MSINTEIATMSNDITCFEEERNKIAIIILVIDNYKVVNIIDLKKRFFIQKKQHWDASIKFHFYSRFY